MSVNDPDLDGVPSVERNGAEYPTPGPWVLAHSDGDGTLWRFYPILADADVGEEDAIEYEDGLPAPKVTAYLANDVIEEGSGFDADLVPAYRFEIEDVDVFAVREPRWADVIEAVADALGQLAGGRAAASIDVEVETGEDLLGPDEDEEEIDRRRQENASLGEWT